MSKLRTVAGPVGPESAGITYIHEHLCIDLRTPEDREGRLADEDAVVQDLAEVAALGGRTIVELTNRGMGRDPVALRRVAERSGLNVIAATGFYFGRFLPGEVRSGSVEELAVSMERELVEGIGDTGIAAGLIGEIGSSRGEITPLEEKVFRAAARAQRQTGVPIMTHTSYGTMAPEQVALLDRAGADLSRVSLSHLDLVADLEYHESVLRTGVFIQFDTIGKERYMPDETRLRLLLELLDRGWERQIMLSCDISLEAYLRSRGGHGYGYLLRTFVPRLRQAGVEEQAVEEMLVHNPARFLAW